MGLFSPKSLLGLYLDSKIACVYNPKNAQPNSKTPAYAQVVCQNVMDSEPDTRQKVLESVRSVFLKVGAIEKNVALSLPGEMAITRYFELPILPKKEEKNAVRFEAQKYIPIDMRDLYFDYQSYADPEKKKTAVVFFACKKQWLDSVTALLQSMGAKLVSAELNCQSVARSFYQALGKDSNEVCLILSGNGDGTFEAIIEKEGLVLTTRHLSLSASSDQKNPDIPLLVSDVRISMDYFAENFKMFKLSRIFVATPFETDAAAVCDALRKELTQDISHGPIYNPNQEFTVTGAVSAYGVTLEPKSSLQKINLKAEEAQSAAAVVSWDEEKKQLQDMATRILIGGILFFAVLYIFFASTINQKIQGYRSAVAAYPKSETASISEAEDQLEMKGSLLSRKVSFMNAFLGNTTPFTLRLNEIVKNIPANVQLSRLNFREAVNPNTGVSEATLTLEGFVLSGDAGAELSAVNKFVSQLSGHPYFMKGMDSLKIVSTKKEYYQGQLLTKFVLDASSKKASS